MYKTCVSCGFTDKAVRTVLDEDYCPQCVRDLDEINGHTIEKAVTLWTQDKRLIMAELVKYLKEQYNERGIAFAIMYAYYLGQRRGLSLSTVEIRQQFTNASRELHFLEEVLENLDNEEEVW